MLPKAPHKLVESPRSALNRRTWTPWAEGVPIVVQGSQGRRMHLTLFCITDLCSAMTPCFDAFCTLECLASSARFSAPRWMTSS